MQKLTFALVLCIGAAAYAEPAGVLVIPSVRVKFAVPAGWHALSTGGVDESLRRLRLSNPALNRLLQERQHIPKLTFTKHPGNFPSLNPTLQVYVVSTNRTPEEIVQATVTEASGMPRFKLLEPPRGVTLAGRKAAMLRATFQLSGPGGTEAFMVESRMLAVVDGKEAVVFGFSGQATGEDRVEADFQRLFASLAPVEPSGVGGLGIRGPEPKK